MLVDFYSGKPVTQEFIEAENDAFDYFLPPMQTYNGEYAASMRREKFNKVHRSVTKNHGDS